MKRTNSGVFNCCSSRSFCFHGQRNAARAFCLTFVRWVAMVSRLFLSSSQCRWLECFDFSARVKRERGRVAKQQAWARAQQQEKGRAAVKSHLGSGRARPRVRRRRGIGLTKSATLKPFFYYLGNSSHHTKYEHVNKNVCYYKMHPNRASCILWSTFFLLLLLLL